MCDAIFYGNATTISSWTNFIEVAYPDLLPDLFQECHSKNLRFHWMAELCWNAMNSMNTIRSSSSKSCIRKQTSLPRHSTKSKILLVHPRIVSIQSRTRIPKKFVQLNNKCFDLNELRKIREFLKNNFGALNYTNNKCVPWLTFQWTPSNFGWFLYHVKIIQCKSYRIHG